MPLTGPQLAAVSHLFAVLSEPRRLTLLQALQGGGKTVNQLVEACGMKQANVSKHLAALHHQRLVGRERNGNSIRYAISDPIVFSLCDLVCRKMAKDAKELVAVFHPDI